MPTRDWKVTRITKSATTDGLHVEGENLNYPPEHPMRRFSWTVQGVQNPRYDLTDAKIEI